MKNRRIVAAVAGVLLSPMLVVPAYAVDDTTVAQTTVSTCEEEVVRLQATVYQQKQVIDRLVQNVNRQAAEIQALRAANDAQREQIDELTVDLATVAAERDQLLIDNDRLRRTRDRLRARIIRLLTR